MANGVVVQFAVLSVLGVVLVCLLMLNKKRNAQREAAHKVLQVRLMAEKSKSMQLKPMPSASSRKAPEAERRVPQKIAIEAASTNVPPDNTVKAASSSTASGPAAPSVAVPSPANAKVVGDEQRALTTPDDRNERILAGISENIRKSLQTRPVPQRSLIPYSETQPRNTEYVRVKKEIITPHGHIRFSILKDWVSTNMLAVLRRASLDWKTPDDLIAFLPSYLEPDAEILNGQVLLIGTPGHDEKLAVPLRSLDAASRLRDCFDFATDARTTTNTPAVLLPCDSEFEVVSRGVITQSVFMNAGEQGHTEVKVLVERSPEALQNSYSVALRRRVDSTAVAPRVN